MPKKTFPGQEILTFDTTKNCMVLNPLGSANPCVNWYQYEKYMRVRGKLDGTGVEIETIKGGLRGAFVATLVVDEDGRDNVVIAHSIVHPSDRHKAFKAHGRTVAAKRLTKQLESDVAVEDLPHLAYYLNAEAGEEANFFVLEEEILDKVELFSPAFLPAIYRRLKKLNG